MILAFKVSVKYIVGQENEYWLHIAYKNTFDDTRHRKLKLEPRFATEELIITSLEVQFYDDIVMRIATVASLSTLLAEHAENIKKYIIDQERLTESHRDREYYEVQCSV